MSKPVVRGTFEVRGTQMTVYKGVAVYSGSMKIEDVTTEMQRVLKPCPQCGKGMLPFLHDEAPHVVHECSGCGFRSEA